MDAWPLLTEVVCLLAACLAGGALFSRLKQSPIAGYLLAGMVVGGPGSLHLVRSQGHIEFIAELGVALLLFTLGLEFSVSRLRSLGKAAILGGVLQVAATLGAVLVAVLVMGGSGSGAVTLGAMIALSSTAVVLRTLVVRGELDSRYGRATVAVLLVQDVALVPLAVLVASLGEGGDALVVLTRVGETLGLSLLLMVVLYVAITQGVTRFLRRLGAERNREFSVLLAVVIGFGATVLAHSVGLSSSLGAFLAGMFLGSSQFALQLRADVASLRTVLLTLFFGAVGMMADPLWIAGNIGLVVGVALLVVVAKVGIAWAVLRLVALGNHESMAAALCLAQVGEFAFVLGAVGLSHGTIDQGTYGLIISVAVVSLVLTPYLIAVAPHAGPFFSRLFRRGLDDSEAVESGPLRYDVVLIGFGPAGREALLGVNPSKHSVCVIELNEESVADAERAGYDSVLGDATQEDVLLHAGVPHARVIVVTPPSPSLCKTVLDIVRTMAPEATCLVRARHARDVPLLESAGAAEVASDESEVGSRLQRLVADVLGGQA